MHGSHGGRESSPAGPYLVPAGRSRQPDALVDVKAAATDTGSAVSVTEFSLPPWSQGPVLHVHETVDEALYVLAGRLDLQLGERRLFAEVGDFVWMPSGVPHGFSCASDEAARALALAVPGGLEDMFRDQAAYLASVGDHADPVELDRIGRRHGARTLGPPVVPRRADGTGSG